MSFNIWERWPWTSFQNLNLDWLMKAVKEAVTKSEQASESVGQFDDRITANENAIEQLGNDMETISSPVRVYVNNDLEAYYRGNHITGVELLTMAQTHGDLPYVEFNGEVYMLDTVSTAGDLRFSMCHTVTGFDDLVVRHILIPAQSYNAAYSITNVGSGGSGSSNVMVVTITDSGSGYSMDSTYAAIVSQLNAGKAVIVRVQRTGSTGAYAVSGMIFKETTTVQGQTMGVLCIIDPNMIRPAGAFSMYAWYIYENNTVDHGIIHENIATWAAVVAWVNDGDTNALLKTAQTLTAAQQAQVKQNLGISDSGGSYSPYLIPVSQSGTVYSTTATGEDVEDHIIDCRILFNGVYYYPIGATLSGPFGDAYFACSDPSNSGTIENDIFAVHLNGDQACTITKYDRDIGLLPIVSSADAGKFARVNSSGAWVAESVPSAESNSFGGA